MLVLVMNIREMIVHMSQRRVLMQVVVVFSIGNGFVVRVLMMIIVRVFMGVLQRGMQGFVCVALCQVKPDPQ